MSQHLTPISDKEKRLALAVRGLDEREKQAYRYFIKMKQVLLAEATSDEMFDLYVQGRTCEEIRRMHYGFSLGQIVACKVVYDWDARRSAYRSELEKNVPSRSVQVHLEQVDLMADLLTASQLVMREQLRNYISTKDRSHLRGVPIPTTVKEYKDFFELFMRATGQDKKRIEVSGSVSVGDKPAPAPTELSSENAMSLMDELLDVDVVAATPEPDKGGANG